MTKLKLVLYTFFMVFSTISVYAASPAEASPLTSSLFVFIPTALLAVLAGMLIWKFRERKKKDNVIHFNNRGPVRKTIIGYKRRKALHGYVKAHEVIL
ncbi:MAG: hypothetical protein K2X86_11800 [Cytophagaceae bacterium]|nr:hypothetical protein [Cytophagaceae bacterium]